MDNNHPTFSFSYNYADRTAHCKVVMQPTSYDIFFDGRWMAVIAHTEEWTWIQESGVILPDETIEEIGLRIESEYK